MTNNCFYFAGSTIDKNTSRSFYSLCVIRAGYMLLPEGTNTGSGGMGDDNLDLLPSSYPRGGDLSGPSYRRPASSSELPASNECHVLAG